MDNLEEIRNITTITRDITTILAIVVGGIWAWYKWGYSENIRRKKELSAIDGTLNYEVTELNEKQVIISFEALWRNKGVLAVELEDDKSFLIGRKLDADNINEGELLTSKKHDIKAPLFSGGYILEPKTDSIMQKQIIVSKNDIYFFEWIIGLHHKHAKEFDAKDSIYCSREIIVNPQSKVKDKPEHS